MSLIGICARVIIYFARECWVQTKDNEGITFSPQGSSCSQISPMLLLLLKQGRYRLLVIMVSGIPRWTLFTQKFTCILLLTCSFLLVINSRFSSSLTLKVQWSEFSDKNRLFLFLFYTSWFLFQFPLYIFYTLFSFRFVNQLDISCYFLSHLLGTCFFFTLFWFVLLFFILFFFLFLLFLWLEINTTKRCAYLYIIPLSRVFFCLSFFVFIISLVGINSKKKRITKLQNISLVKVLFLSYFT